MQVIQEFLGSFNELTKQDWTEILVILGVATFLGFLLGWILRSFKVSNLKLLLAEKSEAYTNLNGDYQDNLKLLSVKEDEEMHLHDKIKGLNDEVERLKLKLSTANEVPAVINEQALNDDELGLVEDMEEDNSTKKSWLNKIRDVFSTNQPIGMEADSEANEISTEEKLKATNNLVDRLLNSNEKLEDENESLKNKVIELEEKANSTKLVVDEKPIIEKQPEPLVIDKSEVEKYTKSLKEARVTGQDLLKRIQELEIYNGKIIKELEGTVNQKNALESKLATNGDFKVRYTDLAAKYEQKEIKNNKLAAELQSKTSTAKQNTFEVELKNKTALLEDCTKEKSVLENKLKTLTEQIEIKNKKEEEDKKKKAEQREAERAKAKQAQEAKRQEEIKIAEAKRLEKLRQDELKAKQAAETKKLEETKRAEEAKRAEAKRIEEKKQAELKAKKSDTVKTEAKPAADASHDIIKRIKSKAANIDFNRIGKGNMTQKDDLKKIKGIGEFVEKKLNALGIYNFKQIANFNGSDIEKVNDAIEFFPGRIERDSWVDQAKKLA